MAAWRRARGRRQALGAGDKRPRRRTQWWPSPRLSGRYGSRRTSTQLPPGRHIGVFMASAARVGLDGGKAVEDSAQIPHFRVDPGVVHPFSAHLVTISVSFSGVRVALAFPDVAAWSRRWRTGDCTACATARAQCACCHRGVKGPNTSQGQSRVRSGRSRRRRPPQPSPSGGEAAGGRCHSLAPSSCQRGGVFSRPPHFRVKPSRTQGEKLTRAGSFGRHPTTWRPAPAARFVRRVVLAARQYLAAGAALIGTPTRAVVMASAELEPPKGTTPGAVDAAAVTALGLSCGSCTAGTRPPGSSRRQCRLVPSG